MYVLVALPLLAVALSFLFSLDFLFSVVLFLILPSLYLSYRSRQYVKKTLLFSLVFGVRLR